MFTIFIESQGKPMNTGDVEACGTGLLDGFAKMTNSGTNGAWSCPSNFHTAKIYVNGQKIGVYKYGAKITL